MSCFWDAITANLTKHQLVQKRIRPTELIIYLKERNQTTPCVLWQGEQLTDREMLENFEHVKNYNPALINQGYLCAARDPFLYLVCQLFKVNIEHDYISTLFYFTQKCICKPFITMRFKSSSSHFDTN